ncbi:MAG: hypothetical protein QM621_13835 [Aeromicrobium sp.]|uniref:hypothetical protein n=1 Tax=Aeromicrobium sp. TaxID=1871063 RepID=UPI0039E47381
MPEALHAWIDESVEVSHEGPGFYILAASVTQPSAENSLRNGLRDLVFPGQPRLHWRDENSRRRDTIVTAISTMDLKHLAVIAPAEAKRQERARRKCLERLLYELDQTQVVRCWLESRQPASDRRDHYMVETLRGSQTISDHLRVAFTTPLDEPLLWLPDAVAGMTLADQRAGTAHWARRLGDSYRVIRL